MNYQINQIKSTLSSSVCASAAGVDSMVGRVFIRMGEQDSVGKVNIGRLPIIEITSTTVNYEFQAEPNHEGTRTADYNMRIIVPTFINRSEDSYLRLETIKQTALYLIASNLNLGLTNVQESPTQVTQMYSFMDVKFSTESSCTKTYDET